MFKSQGGVGGEADLGKSDIFTKARVKFPTPGNLQNVKFLPLATVFAQHKSLPCQIPETKCQKSHPRNQFPVGSPPSYPGLNIDRCISGVGWFLKMFLLIKLLLYR